MASCDEDTEKLSPGRGLQGARPPPLKVSKSSCKIKKKPPQQGATGNAIRPPVIIYLRSPEVIHVEACNFMNLVQRLTGNSSASSSSKSNDAFGCNTNRVADGVDRVHQVPATEELVGVGPQHDVHGAVLDHMYPTYGMFPSASSSVSPGPFVVSPNVYPDIHDFGMISYSVGYQDTVSTSQTASPTFNCYNF